MSDDKNKEITVEAECHSDDYKYRIAFDAAPFFEAAADDEIRALERCGWGGDYEADDVARFCEDRSDGLRRLFEYLSHEPTMPLSKDKVGFECHVDAASARRWLEANRAALAAELFADDEEEEEEAAVTGAGRKKVWAAVAVVAALLLAVFGGLCDPAGDSGRAERTAAEARAERAAADHRAAEAAKCAKELARERRQIELERGKAREGEGR
jgi:hypothetical protein